MKTFNVQKTGWEKDEYSVAHGVPSVLMYSRGKGNYWKVKKALRIGFSAASFVPWCSMPVHHEGHKCTGSGNENSRLQQDVELPRSPKQRPVPHRLTGSPDKILKAFVQSSSHHPSYNAQLLSSINPSLLSLHLSVQSYPQTHLQGIDRKPERKAAIHHVNLSTWWTGFNQILKTCQTWVNW